jgi:hypothetical protein
MAAAGRARRSFAANIDSLRTRPHGVARLGTLVCVAAAVVVGAFSLDEALGVFDYRADVNASRSYLDRTYGDDGDVVGSRRVVEDAHLWMPEDATYRIVVGAGDAEGEYDPVVAPDFLRYFLLPRRESASGPWVFCLGCDVSALGDRFQALSKDGSVVFGRMSG